MNIYAKNGHRVRCTKISNGVQYDTEIAKRHLLLNEEYTVEETHVYNWLTHVFLQEFPGIAFNSVFFDDVEEQSLEYTKKNPDYAP